MTFKRRDVLIPISGMFAGGLTASLVPLSLLPKALLVGVVAASVSIVVGTFVRRAVSRDLADQQS